MATWMPCDEGKVQADFLPELGLGGQRPGPLAAA
jgi:hypothetical protein